MKTLRTFTLISATVLLTALGPSAQAGTIINNFTTPYDYTANGIVGDTNWDGIYLNLGDIPNNNNAGGDGSGLTLVANSAVTFPGYLSIRTQGTDWAGADNDGFFIWKLVTGDFDVSVQVSPFTLNGGNNYDNRANNISGLMVRAYRPDNSGAPYSLTSTNFVENYVMNWRFQNFNINEVNEANNGVRAERTYPDSNTDVTNTTRYFRIVRSSLTNFSYYWKTNSGDSWVLITNGSLSAGFRSYPQLIGPLQVGIAEAAFSTASRDSVFTDFQLTGTGVTFPPLPAGAPSALVTTATNTGGSLTFSWTVGDAVHDRSLVIVRATGNIQASPIQGIVYNANAAYGDTNTAVAAGREFVVYNGTGNSVTVTNLAGTNIVYTVAVYEYSNAVAPVYNTASPAVNAFLGPGIVTGVSASVAATNLPVGGAAVGKLFATFSSGAGLVDESTAASWSSSDTTIVSFNGSTLSALAAGTATVTGSFAGFTTTQIINVHAPVYTDNFTATNDYVANGLIGTPYDGLFLNFGDVPGAVAGAAPDGAGSTINFDSQISNTNGLFVSSVLSTWQGAANDGPFLYKIVPGSINSVSGDFEAFVHINSMNTLNGAVAGIMARLYNPLNHGAGPGNAENHVNYWKVQNGTTSVRRTQNGGNNTIVAAGPAAADGWLMIQRVSSTNFYFFEKANAADLWTFVTNIVQVNATNNAPMEVGIVQQSTAGVNATATFDSFMLDAAGINSGTPPPAPAANLQITLNLDLSMTISYTVGTNSDGTAIRTVVVMRDGGPVTAQPYTGMALGGNPLFGDPNNSLGDGNYVVFRSLSGDTNRSQSVTVTGLTPGHTYYAAVYTFVGLGATRTFNENASNTARSQQDGILLFLETLPTPALPRGGIGTMQVFGHYTGGAVVNISPFATVTSDNTNVIKVQAGILTGITNGTANISLVFGGITNSTPVAVRGPSFVDEFDANHDYLATGLAGTSWQGLYNTADGTNPIPSSPYVPLAGSGTTVADANISSNGVLTLTAAGDGWENAASGGFFLFRYVPGDFQMAVQVQSYDIAAFNQPGLLARVYGVDSGGNIGAPFGLVVPNANGTNDLGEYWVSFSRFDEFVIGTYARRNIDSAVTQSTQTDPGPNAISGATGSDTNYWLLIVRTKGTEFDFYKRASLTDTWKQVPNKTHYSLAQFAGQPMQAGIMTGPFTGAAGASRAVRLDHFMLDTTTGSPLTITRSGSNVILSWPAIPATLQSKTNVVSPTWQNVGGTPALGPKGYSLTLPAGSVPTFYRLVQ